ncbi:hypothetical protein D9M72_376750 [compost metagenome]
MDAAADGLQNGSPKELEIRPHTLGRTQPGMIVGHLVRRPVHRLAPEPGHGPRVRTVDHHRGNRPGVPVDRPWLQHPEQIALRVGQCRPWHVALAHVGGRRPKLLQPRDQLRLVGRGGGGEIEVRPVANRLGVGDGDHIHADGDGVRPDEAHGFNVGHSGPFAGNTPAERLRPKPAERCVIPGLEIHLNELQCHTARPYNSQRPKRDAGLSCSGRRTGSGSPRTPATKRRAASVPPPLH